MMDEQRSRQFESSPLNRFWWHKRPGNQFVPAVYALLPDDEWEIIHEWFLDTEKRGLVGETSIPMISLLQGSSWARARSAGSSSAAPTPDTVR
jgi:hypothetical protein